MKYYIKQSVMTLTERFTIKNEYGEDVFRVEGSFLKIPKSFSIYDMNGQQIVYIEKQLFRWLSRYDVTYDNKFVTVKREFTFFKTEVSLEGLNWRLQGDYWDHNYQVIEGNNPIMSLRKHWFTWGDSYELDIENTNDAPLCIAIAIIIDRIQAEQNNS